MVYKKIYAFGLRNANNVFFQNKTNLNLFKENNIINEQYKILPGSGVNIEEFQPKFNNKMSKKISFLFIGRLMKEKGIEEYLKAADVLTDIYNNIEFQILGFYEEKNIKKC